MNTYVLAFLVVGVSAMFTGCCVAVTRKHLKRHVAEGHNDVLVPMFLMAGTIYAVLLGFLVIAVWETYESAKDNVAEEAATLVSLYRETDGMQKPEGDKMRSLIREYAEAVITDEWKTQAESGQASNKARRAIGDMDREFTSMDPKVKVLDEQINSAFLTTVSQVVADRNRRNFQSRESLSWVMWFGAVGGGLIVVAMSVLLFMDRTWPHVLMSAAMTALIGILLFIMLVMNHPFAGDLGISSEPFESTLKTLDAVDQGN